METTGKSLRAVPPCTNEERQKRKIMCNKASQSSVAVMQGDWGEKPHHCLGRIPFQLARLVHGALHGGFLILPDAFAFFKIPYQVYARAQLVFGNFYHQQVSQFICFRGKQMRFTEPHYLSLVTETHYLWLTTMFSHRTLPNSFEGNWKLYNQVFQQSHGVQCSSIFRLLILAWNFGNNGWWAKPRLHTKAI